MENRTEKKEAKEFPIYYMKRYNIAIPKGFWGKSEFKILNNVM